MYKALNDRADLLMHRIVPENRWIDMRVRFQAYQAFPDGRVEPLEEFSNVYGGILDVPSARYDEARTLDADPDSIHTIPVSQKQLQVVESEKMRQAVSGSRGGGKSVAAICRVIRRAVEWPGKTTRVLCTHMTFCESLHNKILRRIPPSWVWRWKEKAQLCQLINGSVISYRSTRIKEGLVSVGYATLLVDELQNMDRRVLQLSWPNMRKLQGAPRNIIATFTPAVSALEFWSKCLCDPKTDCWELADGDNAFLGSKKDRDELRHDSLLDEEIMAIEFGDWDAVRQAFEQGKMLAFPAFDPETHIIDQIPYGWKDCTDAVVRKYNPRIRVQWIIGVDWGSAVHSNVTVWKVYQRSGRKRRWIAHEHFLVRGQGPEVVSELRSRKYLPSQCFVVPDATGNVPPKEGGKSSVRAMRAANYILAPRTVNPFVVDRISAANELLRPDDGSPSRMYFLRAKTGILVWSMANVLWSTSSPGKLSKTPLSMGLHGRDPTDAADSATYPIAFLEPVAPAGGPQICGHVAV